MTKARQPETAIGPAAAISRWDDEGGAAGARPTGGEPGRIPHAAPPEPSVENKRREEPVIQLAGLAVDESDHSRDGLVLHGRDRSEQVTAFIGRKVMDEWLA